MQRQTRPFLIAMILLFLNGCVSLSLPQNNTSFEAQTPRQRASQLARIQHWHISGALSLRTPQKTSLANFTWSQQGLSRFNLHISSSLNLYVLIIHGQPGLVTIDDGKRHRLSGPSASALIKKMIGYPLPINNLYYWIRGLSAPGTTKATHDRFGHLQRLQQQSWKIRFSHYTRINGVDLPRMLDLSSTHYIIRIVIKQWNF